MHDDIRALVRKADTHAPNLKNRVLRKVLYKHYAYYIVKSVKCNTVLNWEDPHLSGIT